MCGWDQSYTVSVEHLFVCSIYFYIFTKRYRRTKIDFFAFVFFDFFSSFSFRETK